MPKKEAEISLSEEAPIVYEYLMPYVGLHREERLSSADFISIFILIYISMRRPKRWCTSFSQIPLSGEVVPETVHTISLKNLTSTVQELISFEYIAKKFKMPVDDVPSLRVVDLFNHLSLSAIKHNSDNYINKFTVLNVLGQRPVCLMHRIPKPLEVLMQQARGERVVTMFLTIDELSRCHVSKLRYMTGSQEHARDPLEFLLHDIRHMEHFVLADTYWEQVGFFKAMASISSEESVRDFFIKSLGYPKMFWYELEYVLSDMNCYSTHLLRYLHAKWIVAFRNKYLEGSLSTTEIEEAEISEWSTIVSSIFRREYAQDAESEGDILPIETYQLAKDSAIALNAISHKVISDLTMEQWESIRSYFAWRGKLHLRLHRDHLPALDDVRCEPAIVS